MVAECRFCPDEGTCDMILNDLLLNKGIDPQTVLVFRHRHHEPQLNKVLPWLAAEQPEVFTAYQQTQGEKAEKAMSAASYVASFIGHAAGKALFIGLYSIGASRPLTRAEYRQVPAHIELEKFGARGFTADDPRSSVLWFDLAPTPFHAEWKGKLIVDWRLRGDRLRWQQPPRPMAELHSLGVRGE